MNITRISDRLRHAVVLVAKTSVQRAGARAGGIAAGAARAGVAVRCSGTGCGGSGELLCKRMGMTAWAFGCATRTYKRFKFATAIAAGVFVDWHDRLPMAIHIEPLFRRHFTLVGAQ
jgi:hypothetical protein